MNDESIRAIVVFAKRRPPLTLQKDIWPHRTHQNGLVVDFMTPVVDRHSSEPTTLGTWRHDDHYHVEFSR